MLSRKETGQVVGIGCLIGLILMVFAITVAYLIVFLILGDGTPTARLGVGGRQLGNPVEFSAQGPRPPDHAAAASPDEMPPYEKAG